MAAEEEPTRGQPVIVVGQIYRRPTLPRNLPGEPTQKLWRIAIAGARPLALVFPEGWPGPATLTYEDETGPLRTETWPAMPPRRPSLPLLDARSASPFTCRQPPASTEERCWTTPGLGNHSTAIIQAAETI